MKPQTLIGRRRLRILRRVALFAEEATIPRLSTSLGLCPRTLLNHLHVMEDLGLVIRTTYHRWQLADGITLAGLDGSRLDPGGSHVADR
jgi:DNA-binding IclR family transcriptional regulator